MRSSELVALVIGLRALVPTQIENHMGRAVQSLGLNLLGTHDEALAQSTHNATDLKPFTASGLMGNRGLWRGTIKPGDRVWVRFTGLSGPVSAALLAYYKESVAHLAAGQDIVVEIDHLPWAVASVHLDDHPWAGQVHYQSLIDRHREARAPRQITLHYHTPTTFRSQGSNMPLPLPRLVFGSLLDRWTMFTSHRLRDLPRDQVSAFIAYHMLLSRHNIRTALVYGKNGGKEVGFTGEATFTLSRRSDHLKRYEPELEAILQREYLWFARTMGLLADFALYSGIGRKTTTGLGAARESRRR